MAITIPVYGDQPEKTVEGALMAIASTEHLEGMADYIEERSVFFEWVLIWLLVLTSAVAAMLFMRPFQRLQKSVKPGSRRKSGRGYFGKYL